MIPKRKKKKKVSNTIFSQHLGRSFGWLKPKLDTQIIPFRCLISSLIPAQAVSWAEDVVDNENMDKKSSKSELWSFHCSFPLVFFM